MKRARNRSIRRITSKPLALLAAAISPTIAAPARADTYYLQPDSGSSPFNWNSTANTYTTWFDQSARAKRDVPTNGSSVFMFQSGSTGIANAIVTFNYAYSGPGISDLTIASGNTIQQTSATSAM